MNQLLLDATIGDAIETIAGALVVICVILAVFTDFFENIFKGGKTESLTRENERLSKEVDRLTKEVERLSK